MAVQALAIAVTVLMGNMNTNKLVISVYIAVLPAMAIVHIVLLKSISMNRAMVNVCIVALLAMAIVRIASLASTNTDLLSPKVCPKNSRAHLFTQKLLTGNYKDYGYYKFR